MMQFISLNKYSNILILFPLKTPYPGAMKQTRKYSLFDIKKRHQQNKKMRVFLLVFPFLLTF